MPNKPRPTEDLYDLALYVYRYARRWAVSQSSDPADAVIYDACIAAINDTFAPNYLESSKTVSAARDRYLRNGYEPPIGSFSIPITAPDALVVLHRYARRYTNGRGSFTAALVNQTAVYLQELGMSLEETRRLDGTIWAADGSDGAFDGLTEEQRAEALSVLPYNQPSDEPEPASPEHP